MSNARSIEPFERACTERLRRFVEQFGHVLAWERVGSVQDIWLQLAHGKSPDDEGTSTALCSFQLHGIRATDLDRHAYHRLRDVTVPVHEVGDDEVIWRVGTADVRGAVHALHL